MRPALAIARKELEAYFTTPLAWVMLTVVAFFAALFFNGSLDVYRFYTLRAFQFQDPSILERMNLTDMVVGRVFNTMAVLIVIVAPVLSGRLLAEEKRSRTFELLMTSPLRPVQIVLGKYLAALAVMGAAVAMVAAFPLVLAVASRGAAGGAGVEWQTVGTGLLGLFLFGAAAMSLGLLCSALTESVIVASLVSFIVLFTLWIATIFTVGVEGPVKDLVAALSASEHLGAFLAGRVELRDLVYYLSLTALGLYLAERVVEGHRWA
jgi:gliding motility-associated transport system permease protein